MPASHTTTTATVPSSKKVIWPHETSVSLIEMMVKSLHKRKEQIWAYICRNHHPIVEATNEKAVQATGKDGCRTV
ncbi:uncharacterized protein ACA1_249150 [Acanthamoeba castellanii str. Neff]|uniref:Uncharacterized protein n=1 Tax=Acanthamoeba castellanii (strain ATCC 30010 / Neff) TaxID=1257118 RepID=L8GZB0_ACACF|nr:uncharacterized protein ACA1_249150 [Acanthamoeba castellanii str. Neff]ELR17868.1 hypothetical protein ACA1_249150 [Acanthamoeba castellanii str. Neff]